MTDFHLRFSHCLIWWCDLFCSMWELGIPPDGPVCFGQLLGMCDHVSLALGMWTAHSPPPPCLIQPQASLLGQVPSHISSQCLVILLSRTFRWPCLQTLPEKSVTPMSKALQAFVSVTVVCCLAGSWSCCLVSYVLCYLYHFAPQWLRPKELCFPLPLYPKFIASGLLRYPRHAI